MPSRWRSGAGGRASAELVHHSDRGVQYLSIRYTERLAEAEAVTRSDLAATSCDNALAETVNGLYKAELINRHGPGGRSRGRAGDRRPGSTSGTPSGSMGPAATCRRPSSRPPTMPAQGPRRPPEIQSSGLHGTQYGSDCNSCRAGVRIPFARTPGTFVCAITHRRTLEVQPLRLAALLISPGDTSRVANRSSAA